eukprot:TRINITY_DN4646_c1_g1_i4.p2 TRINITY_DN4646_c1_g1~~TRINITY_DN4646_c1_g1_i4.p2  ORF type:complete len:272 (-),score=45.42 TRINITY_DN4646_c1_g1_i4:41-856(-)
MYGFQTSCQNSFSSFRRVLGGQYSGNSRTHMGKSQSYKANMATLISFDVDGTLIHSIGQNANKLHKDAFKHALLEVFNIDTHIDVIPHHGSTDPLILLAVLEHHGIQMNTSVSKLEDMKDCMNKYVIANQEKSSEGLEILPGVDDLLKILKDSENVLVCLVTGNLQPIGWLKMKHLGILPYFSNPNFGGFGSDFCSGNTKESWKDRAELVKIAYQKAKELHDVDIVTHYHVGDTPMDIKAAIVGNATPIGVTTGIFTEEQLQEAGKEEGKK